MLSGYWTSSWGDRRAEGGRWRRSRRRSSPRRAAVNRDVMTTMTERLLISELQNPPAVRHLHAGFHAALWNRPPTDRDRERLRAFTGREFSGPFALILTPAGETIGWGGYQLTGGTLNVDSLAVLPRYRRLGLGTWLVTRFVYEEVRTRRPLHLAWYGAPLVRLTLTTVLLHVIRERALDYLFPSRWATAGQAAAR
ncbi:GNAT family N-acetyltransferase [Pseudonocardiaceae bacterium YIM PH 21723]|nr:GNAT family N-acetyltransferase [Pseudonocardiaceae bacterium YIM PH 21723]